MSAPVTSMPQAPSPSEIGCVEPVERTAWTTIRAHAVISRHRFAQRMGLAVAIWLGLAVFGLGIGMAGYAFFEGMSGTDAYVNAAMILSGLTAMNGLFSRD